VADLGGSAVSSYDVLYENLREAPARVSFPLPSGSSAVRTFSATDLATVAAESMYDEAGRSHFLRALAAANVQDDFVPLLRLKYQILSIDSLTEAALPDPLFSPAAYYAIECSDYNFFAGTPDERAEAFMRAGDAVDASLERLGTIFYTDFPCVFWGVEGEQGRPAPLVAEGVTTFVLNAALDPATPAQQGHDVFNRLADAYEITMEGGPHVIFGRGNQCPDAAVTAWMVNGTLPAEREARCSGRVMDTYIRLSPQSFGTIEEGMNALDIDLSFTAEYRYWDLSALLTIGCTHGGGVEFVPTETGELWNLVECAMSPHFVVSGTGILDYESEQLILNVEARLRSDPVVFVTYTRSALFAGEGETETQVQQ
jgi:hypothetical protein